MFVLNTVLVICLQVRAARGATDLAGALKLLTRGGRLLVVACVVISTSSAIPRHLVDVPIVAGYLLLVGAELFISPAQWTLLGELSDRETRGQYVAVWSLCNQLVRLVALPVYSLLVLRLGLTGWLAIAVVLSSCILLAQSRLAAKPSRAGTA
jgi:sugar phosphate permease